MPVEGDPCVVLEKPLANILLESGNMLIMTLSYTQKTKDMSLLTTYVSRS